MPGKVDIINAALREIGGTRIASPDEDKKNANAARDVYDSTLEDMLRSNYWNFATTRAKLSRLSTAPAFEFDYAYALPPDWLRTVSIHPDSSAKGRTIVHYKMELVAGVRCIICDDDEVYLRYISRVEDPNLWSADFRKAMEQELAKRLAIPVADSSSLKDSMDKDVRITKARARSTDAMGASPERRPRGSWVRRRGTQRPTVGEVSE